jgi:hypothetical protein
MQALVSHVLAAWRQAERVAADPQSDPREREVALAAAERLQELYGQLTKRPPEPADEAASPALGLT